MQAAEEAFSDVALGIDQERIRQTAGLIAKLAREIATTHAGNIKWIIYFVFCCELLDIAIRINANADDLQIFAAKFGLQCAQFRHLFDTWRTPSRPEIDQQNLALPLTQGVLLAI